MWVSGKWTRGGYVVDVRSEHSLATERRWIEQTRFGVGTHRSRQRADGRVGQFLDFPLDGFGDLVKRIRSHGGREVRLVDCLGHRDDDGEILDHFAPCRPCCDFDVKSPVALVGKRNGRPDIDR